VELLRENQGPTSQTTGVARGSTSNVFTVSAVSVLLVRAANGSDLTDSQLPRTHSHDAWLCFVESSNPVGTSHLRVIRVVPIGRLNRGMHLVPHTVYTPVLVLLYPLFLSACLYILEPLPGHGTADECRSAAALRSRAR
jgi:hypothetical protein